jgi:CrcB protein
MTNLLGVMAGGALGSGARYLVAVFAQRTIGHGWPWGTMAVNALGSLLLGLLVHFFAGERGVSEPIKLLFTVGFCGGFTTYSTFNNESLKLFSEGRVAQAALYMALTVTLCLGFGFGGWKIGSAVWPGT